ncbi:MAG: transketolase C-terminal domain-containing protein [Dehalococcoidia bacterium]|jgi:2-oxoglutarate ferredoxin oxidoreductase subunit alpha|nr:transketolase C-terminal domain-containing protein [Dehalococcoidia bacterium]
MDHSLLERLQLSPDGIQIANRRLIQGNEAICEGAIAAGVHFYAGYPITPCTEIAEQMSIRQPQVGGVYLQMEDEVGSINAVMGASLTGKKAMTATAGPGISLMQDGIGWTQTDEIPSLIVNVQRAGPGLGNATRSGQMDVMQARWGPNGDREAVVLAPSSVEEAFWLTLKSVNLSERLRMGVIMLTEGLLGLMREVIDLPDFSTVPIEDRITPESHPDAGQYDGSRTEIRPFASFGTGYRSINGAWQPPGQVSNYYAGSGLSGLDAQDYNIRRLHDKVLSRRDELTFTESSETEDAEVLLIAFGTQARVARFAKDELRRQGVKAGLLRLVTLFPFPEEIVRAAAANAKQVIVPEMNLGQIRGEVSRALRMHDAEIVGVNHVDSTYIEPDEIISMVPAAARRQREGAAV